MRKEKEILVSLLDETTFTFLLPYAAINCSILFLIVCNLLLCLIYRVDFIIVVYAWKKHSIYKVWYYPRFRACAGGVGTRALQMREATVSLSGCHPPASPTFHFSRR